MDEEGKEVESEVPVFKNIEVFNEDFVRDIVFSEGEAIKDSFNVFIKTPEFDNKRRELDDNLSILKIDLKEKPSIDKMTKVFNEIISKISFNMNGTIAQRGMGKDVSNKTNVYQLPEELEKFKMFFQDEDRVSWVDWKSKGHGFDDKDKCPFCAEILDRDSYETEKKIFVDTYNKTTIKNQKDLEDYLITLRPFINISDYDRIYKFTKEIINEEDFNLELKRFCDEADLVNRKISSVISFDSHRITTQDLDLLDKVMKGLLIDKDSIKIFNSEDAINVYNVINENVEVLLSKVETLKQEFKEINGYIEKAIEESKVDINKFLISAGINYEFDITASGETASKTELKYCGDLGETFDVPKIRESLSWGEKNSISLILFMYYALQKDADLIILDDPISSFDKNKKYAIMNRLFSPDSGIKNFNQRTVLLLTHDFEPIIDLKTKFYFANSLAQGYFLTNIEGDLTEYEICAKTDIKSTTGMYLEDATNPELNIVIRVTSLRKYLEYMDHNYKDNMAYNILASLMKGRARDKVNIRGKSSNIMGDEHFKAGNDEILKYIGNFNYEDLVEEKFTQEKLSEKFIEEDNNYSKIQIFRQFYILDKRMDKDFKESDEVLKKFIDESFHIENDYTHSLDYKKFDIVPNFIMKQINAYMRALTLEK